MVLYHMAFNLVASEMVYYVAHVVLFIVLYDASAEFRVGRMVFSTNVLITFRLNTGTKLAGLPAPWARGVGEGG